MRLNLAEPKCKRLPAVLWHTEPPPDPNGPVVSPENFAAFLDWIKQHEAAGLLKIMYHKTEIAPPTG